MRDRWIAWCATLVPAELRPVAFDPAVNDLVHTAAERAGAPALVRAWRHLVFAVAVAAAALECRRLAKLSHPDRPRQGARMLSRSLHDARLAIRRFAREPIFVVVAVATLSLGIGANTAVFRFVNAYVLAPMPWPHASQLVRVYSTSARREFDVMSYADYADVRKAVPAIDLAACVVTTVTIGDDASSETGNVELVTGNYFHLTERPPQVGRWLDERDSVTEGAHAVVVLADDWWRARFGADSAIVGRTIRLNGAPYEIVGVASPGFAGTEADSHVAMWAPMMMQQHLRPRNRPLTVRGWSWLTTIGRAASGHSMRELQAQVNAAVATLNRDRAANDPLALLVAPASALNESTRRAMIPYATLIFAFTGLLFVVACANLAGIMHTRLAARARELAIRQSLGADRRHLAGSWLVESLLLAGLGAIGGIGVSVLATTALARYGSPSIAGVPMPFDWRLVAFTAFLAILVACIFGLAPAIRANAGQIVATLKDEVGTSTPNRIRSRARRRAMILQIAASATLLIASALLVRSLQNLQRFDVGFAIDRVATATIQLEQSRFSEDRVASLTQDALARLRAIPGVTNVAAVMDLPLTHNRDVSGLGIPGHTGPNGAPYISIPYNVVTTDYFSVLGLQFVRGHAWDAANPDGGIVINETMARQYWGDENPVGAVLHYPITKTNIIPLTITGVVRDSSYYEIGEAPMPFLYQPAEARHPRNIFFVARTAASNAAMLDSLAQAITAVDARLTPRFHPFEDVRLTSLAPIRALAASASAFGLLALLLTGTGLYGVISAAVSGRTREIGVRMALGARMSDVQRDVVRESARLVAIAGLVGLIAAYFLAGTLRQWLFQVGAFDPLAYLGVALLLGALALVAAWVPARRAARVDPVIALRS